MAARFKLTSQISWTAARTRWLSLLIAGCHGVLPTLRCCVTPYSEPVCLPTVRLAMRGSPRPLAAHRAAVLICRGELHQVFAKRFATTVLVERVRRMD